MDLGLGQHGVVLELRLAERRGVLFTSALADEAEAADKTYAGNDDELGLSGAEGLEGRLVAQGDFTGLHHQRQARVDGVGGLLSLLDWCHRGAVQEIGVS